MDEFRGFAPIGISEGWNTGIMGWRNKKINYDFSAFGSHGSIIPPFHYSMCEAKSTNLNKHV
jgi:hypothetical protein